MPSEDYNHIKFGYIPDPLDRRDRPIRCYLASDKLDLPPRHLYTHPSPVRNQGSLGSCVGFACAALKEWQEVKQRAWTPFRNVAESWIYWNAKDLDPWGIFEEGTSYRYALKVLQKEGVPTESCWPYQPYNSLEGRGSPTWYAKIVARWGKVSTYARVESVPQMRESIHLHGPLLIGVICFEGIFNPTENGVIPVPKTGAREMGGHAMLIVGYDDNLKAFRVRNSWGATWADNGYGWLPYAYVDKYMIDVWSVVDA